MKATLFPAILPKLFFALLLLVSPPVLGQTLDKIILKADNHILLKSDLQVGILQARQANPKATEADVRCQVAEQLVLAKLMLAKADIDSVTVKDEEVEAELDQRLAYMVQSLGGRDKVEDYYNKSIEQFKVELRAQVKDQLVVRRMQNKIQEEVKITPAQVRRYFNTVPKDSLPFFSTQVELGQIVRVFKAGRERKAAARKKAQDLRDRIMKGEDFDLMARLYSQDPGSGAQGGKILGIQRGQMVPEFEAAAIGSKKGETSQVIESQFGYHIVQLLDKRGNEYDARHILIRPEADIDDQKEAYRFLDSLRGAIVADSLTFSQAASLYSDDQQTKISGGFIIDGSGSSKVSTEELDPKVYFTIDSMQVGQISAPIPYQSEDGKGGFKIIFYKSKTDPHEANLSQDYQRIQAAALAEKKQKAMLKWIEKARKDVTLIMDDELKSCDLFSNMPL